MRKLMSVAALVACSLAAVNTAEAQFRDRSLDRGRNLTRSQSRAALRAENYVFGERGHIPDLASLLYEQSNDVCWEMYRHYHHNRDYRTVYREMFEIRKAAKHIKTLVKENYYRSQHGDTDHIINDLHKMDGWFHHVENDVRRWTPDNPRTYPGRGLQTMMNELELDIHHLMDDYGVKSRIERTVRRNTPRYRSRR